MSMTTLQKVTLISCSVLCVSLFLPKMLLPRGKKDVGQPEVGPGYYPPMMHRLQMPEEGLGQWMEGSHDSGPHSPEVLAKVKGMGTLQIRGATKSNLISQAIPIYGFGILLYILFIIFKMTTRPKGKSTKLVCRFPTMSSEAWQKKRNDELAQLQEKLLETERVMERIVSRRSSTPDRFDATRRKACTCKSLLFYTEIGATIHGSRTSSKVRRASKQEEKLLRKLSKISRVMQEVRLMEGATPEMEAEMVPYTADWEGYPEETYPQYEEPGGRRSGSYDPITILEEPAADSEIPTAEALAEEVVDEEEDDVEEEEEELQLWLPPPPEGELEEKGSSPSRVKKQIRFSDHKDVFHYPKQDTVYEYRYEEVKEEEEEEKEEEDEEGEEEEEEEEQVDETEEEVGDEEDPLMEAEALSFSCDVCSNPEAEAEEEMEEEEYILLSQSEETDSFTPPDMAGKLGVGSFLRMRNRRET
ncbi:protein RIC-3 isoform X2 [Salmo salar]|uniref:Protein RIC-3 isoform X2 n=1 Tax=Salmo salar TaxID=8030 RepID=A0A1S3PUX5_SALSA|nr:protein RIC-3 isoform X2 [Salmo salar]|eukprot:XP_014031482.1 PREDICTED: protein RIC-3-like isoform X2 [Salmo salar]